MEHWKMHWSEFYFFIDRIFSFVKHHWFSFLLCFVVVVDSDANEANDNKIDTSNESTDNSAELNNSNSSSDLSSSSPEQSPDIITTENE